MQRVADIPSEFAGNQSWGVPEQAFAEEGKYSLTYVLFTLITQSRAQFVLLLLRMTSLICLYMHMKLGMGCDV